MKQNMSLTPVRKTTLIGTAILLVALVAAWMFVLSPRSDAVAKVNEEVTSAEQAKLFRMITAAAAEAGIAPQYLTTMTMGPPTAGGGGTSAQLPGVAAPINQIASQLLTVNVSGTPGQIREFVGNLEKLPRAFAVNAISLAQSASTQAPSENASVAPDAQTVTITGQMFNMPKVVDPTAAAKVG